MIDEADSTLGEYLDKSNILSVDSENNVFKLDMHENNPSEVNPPRDPSSGSVQNSARFFVFCFSIYANTSRSLHVETSPDSAALSMLPCLARPHSPQPDQVLLQLQTQS